MPVLPPSRLPVLALDTSTEQLAAGLHTGRDSFTCLAAGGAQASGCDECAFLGIEACPESGTWHTRRRVAGGRYRAAAWDRRTRFGQGCLLGAFPSLSVWFVVASACRIGPRM